MTTDLSRYRVKIAETEAERLGAQRLRYRVFVEEMGAAATAEERAARREWDAFDPWFDHLVLVDRDAPGEDPLDRVVGVYRLMRRAAARAGVGFYGAAQYDLGPIEASPRESAEIGRSCVAPEHRGGAAMALLWAGVADYVIARGVEVLFGVASFPGVDPDAIAEPLSLLHHRHLAPPELRVRARPPDAVPMDRLPLDAIDPARAMRHIPPLIRSYLRFGGVVGEGASIDRPFNTTDVCVLMDATKVATQRRDFLARAVGGRA
jgi:putative hemolysin